MADTSSRTQPDGFPKFRSSDNDSEHDKYDTHGTMPNPYSVVRYNMCSQRVADKVWEECLEEWDLTETSSKDRESLDVHLCAAFVLSTSKDLENQATMVVFQGKQIRLAVIAEKMSAYHTGDNDSHLRMFVRSYKKGYFVAMQWNLLGDPANVEYRAIVAGRIGGNPAHARFMFDTADYVAYAGLPVNADELRLIAYYKGLRTDRAAVSAAKVGEVTPRNDNSAKPTVHPSIVNQVRTAVPSSADARAALMSTGIR